LFNTSLPLEFAIEISFLVAFYAPEVDSLFNKNVYQEYFLECGVGRGWDNEVYA
jgi:hypothetical protein